jgi:hypothetical protein
LERQHERIRELQHETAKRIAEERTSAERRYNYQVLKSLLIFASFAYSRFVYF